MSEPSRTTVYFVFWPARRVLKIGVTLAQRWTVFTSNGAELLASKKFDRVGDALDFEEACHDALGAVCRLAFANKAAASSSGLLGGSSAGYLECFAVPGDLMRSELTAFCDLALDLAAAGGA
ncbi:hypothetical protein NONO_c59950 [Nocardia nova SH22a]|uniref:Uncharacterized protein n=1 Tax=Nocardia nova SH22a TaxID=1415166 RepID=W5TU90_9NOCA|nr:hypothetical protein [Nocardia nova]AHH20771.1 hypothetical protein NONO_c59950 [Nocardia nova SH22a]